MKAGTSEVCYCNCKIS